MKKTSIAIIALIFVMSAAFNSNAQSDTAPKVLRHVVLFKFKDSSSAADVKKVEDAFAQLAKKLPTIKAYEWGTNSSPEGLNQGLTHCFLLTFSSDKDRDDYLIHPEHKAFGKVLGPHLDKVTVVDYWSKE
jgi:hypothetical protein